MSALKFGLWIVALAVSLRIFWTIAGGTVENIIQSAPHLTLIDHVEEPICNLDNLHKGSEVYIYGKQQPITFFENSEGEMMSIGAN